MKITVGVKMRVISACAMPWHLIGEVEAIEEHSVDVGGRDIFRKHFLL